MKGNQTFYNIFQETKIYTILYRIINRTQCDSILKCMMITPHLVVFEIDRINKFRNEMFLE